MIFKSRSWLEAGVCLPKALKEPLEKYTVFPNITMKTGYKVKKKWRVKIVRLRTLKKIKKCL